MGDPAYLPLENNRPSLGATQADTIWFLYFTGDPTTGNLNDVDERNVAGSKSRGQQRESVFVIP